MILNIRQASNRTGIPVRSLYRYIRRGILPAHKLGGNGHSRRHWRIRGADLEAFINGRGVGQAHAEASNEKGREQVASPASHL